MDFDKHFAEVEQRFAVRRKRFDRYFKIVSIAIGLFWVAACALIVFVGYQVATTSPREIGRHIGQLFGDIASGFDDGAGNDTDPS